MKGTILSIFLFIVIALNAQDLTINTPQTINWNKNYYKSYSFLQSGLAVDSDGNTIIVGGFDGVNVDFGANDTISSKENSNIFIAKYDSNNELVFLKNIGGNFAEGSIFADGYANDYASDVKIDGDNNIYVLATIDVGTSETVDFDPEHPETNSIISTSDSWWTIHQNIFIIKYSPDGRMLWYREILDEVTDESCKLFIDSNNDVWATGIIRNMADEIDFDTNKSYTDSIDVIENSNFNMGFVAHYNSNGDFIDAKAIGGGFWLNMNVSVASSGNMYLCGSFSASEAIGGLTIFNSDTTTHISSQGLYELMAENTDIFILKCNTSGDLEWVKTISSTSNNIATGIKVYGDENVCISGIFTGSSVDFDTDNNLSYDTQTSASNGSGFVATYDTDGNLKMLKTIDGGTRTRIQCVDVMDNGCVAIGGDFKGNALFDNISLTTSSSYSNPFIALIDTVGNWYDAQNIVNNGYASIANVEITLDGSVQFIGFDANNYEGYDIQNIFWGDADCELLSTDIADTTPIYRTITDTVCDNYISPGGDIFDTSGIYTDTIAGIARDTIYTLNLTVWQINTDVRIDDNMLSAATMPNASYQWINCENGSHIEGATNQTYTATQNGDYAVIVSNSICSKVSDCNSVTLTGIEKATDSDKLKIFPNPASEVIYIESSLNIEKLSLLDIAGNLILSQSKNNQINIENISKGIYVLKITTDLGIVHTANVIIE